MERERLHYKIYAWSVENCSTRENNWAHRIKGILRDANLEDYFGMSSDSEIFVTGYLKRVLLSYFTEQDKNQWLSDINGTEVNRGYGRNKLRTYRHFEFEYKTEHYVNITL